MTDPGRDTGTTEDDVDRDDAQALSRPMGGDPGADADRHSTTGTSPSEEFVGRVAGDDAFDEGTSGAEARANG